MKKLLLITSLIGIFFVGTAQTKNWTASYYHKNELGIALFTQGLFYPELRIQAENEYFDNTEVSLFIRNDLSVELAADVNLSWGVGASVIEGEFGNFRLPLYLVKNDILTENVSLMLGLELNSDFEDKTKLLPKFGISISF
ncbi:hypothetical protein [Marinifilum flexuosum]|uniref:hypothetical protein n=1 Tax=Marinifilum flexuosum TaxID=1117708 RepID=UPI002492BA3F|nr:hypothetical protein [Marinifilum flexuosum]